MLKKLLLFLVSIPAFAAITNVSVVGTVSTQAVIAYTAPDTSACTLEVSESNTYSPVVHAVDTTLFAGSNSDGGGAVARRFVVGYRDVKAGLDGLKYSRALKAETTHYFRITCGADQATGTFTTSNIPWGLTYADPYPADGKGGYNWPDYVGRVVDPYTGMAFWDFWANAKNQYAKATSSSGVAPTSASGSAWTNAGGILSNDASYATYSGTAQDWLFVSPGPNWYPTDGTWTNSELSFINWFLKGSCSGGVGAGDCDVEVAVTADGVTPLKPYITGTMPASEAVVSFCANSPCSTVNNPGDTITKVPVSSMSTGTGVGRIYNDGANPGKVFFTSATDCNMLQNGEKIVFAIAPNFNETITLSGKNCGATPPQFTADQNYTDLAWNGSAGLPFKYNNGTKGNPRYGLLIRKKSTTAASTISLGWAYYTAAAYIMDPHGPTFTSGGNHRICTDQADSNGYFHCASGQQVYAIKPNADGSPDVRSLGVAYFSGTDFNSGPCGQSNGTADWLWDATDPNVFYCNFQNKNDGSAILVKATYTGNDVAAVAGDPYGGDYQRWRGISVTSTDLTPAAGGIPALVEAFTSAKAVKFDKTKFPSCSADAVQGGYVVINCRNQAQDSFAWSAAFRLSDNTIVAAAPMFRRPGSRWATLHTYTSGGNAPIATLENQSDKDAFFTTALNGAVGSCTRGGTCDTCPSVTVNGWNYTGKKVCSTINVTSTWNGAWGTTPSEYGTGDLLSSSTGQLHFLMPTAAGDTLKFNDSTNEVIRIVQRTSSSQWIVERGVNSDAAICSSGAGNSVAPQSHSNAASIKSMADTPCDPTVGSGVSWYFLDDPDGTDPNSYFYTQFTNHTAVRPDLRVVPKYTTSTAAFSDKTTFRAQSVVGAAGLLSPGLPRYFAGKWSLVDGDAVENHPSAGNVAGTLTEKAYFFDLNPQLLTSNLSSLTKVTGDLWKYVITSAAPNGGSANDYKPMPKHWPIFAYSDTRPFVEVSGPGVTLTGGSSDAWKVCVVYKAGECYAGSQVGEVYLNSPTIVASNATCGSWQGSVGMFDACAGNLPGEINNGSQWKGDETYTNGAKMRSLARLAGYYREGATVNVKPTPDNKFLLMQSSPLIGQIPSIPSTDATDRSGFLALSISVPNPPVGTNNAYIEFGYNAAVPLYCTPRAERCIANAGSFTQAAPFVYPSDYANEAAIPALACSSNCTIAVPVIANRVVWYRAVYRNSSNAIIGYSPVVATVAEAGSDTASPGAALPLSITTTSPLPDSTKGTAYSTSLLVSGGTAPFTWTVTGGSLPPGLTLSGAGAISGTPTTVGSYSFTAQVADSDPGTPQTASRTFALATLPSALVITSTSPLPAGVTTTAYSQTLQASGGTAPYSWSASGTLPTGLSLASNGTISGTPSAAGTYNFTATVVDSTSPQKTASQAFQITITTYVPPLAGGTYTVRLSASGGTAPYSFAISSGGLPTGMILASDGTLSGDPSVSGTYTFTVTITDSVSATATQTYVISVNSSTAPTSGILSGGITVSGKVIIIVAQ